jgi:hypothetical protein
LVYIAVAYGRQNKEQEASEYLIYAKKLLDWLLLPELPILKLFCLLESLKKLKKIEQGNFDDIPNKTKYRLLVNIAVAYGRQNKEQERNVQNNKSILFTAYYY